MTSTQILIMIAELVGGLAFFLFGMNVMSGGLEKMAGGGLERTLKKVTKNGFFSFTLGAGITIAIQSSSAMTVMLVGLVNSGILAFSDTFSMIMGSNVGTTLTSWIISLTGVKGDNFFLTLLQPMTFSLLFAFIGIAIQMFSKKDKQKMFGSIFIGFAILMVGMDMMGNSMDTFQENPAFQSLLKAFNSPLLALLAATVFTGVIQSSAATVAIIQSIALTSMASGNPLTFQAAIPLVIGANIGTCVTSAISAIGTSRDAKRVSILHVYVNAIGGVICVAVMYILQLLGVAILNEPISIVGVAIVHTIFNIFITLLFTPFKKYFIKLCELTVRHDKSKEHTVFLDERLFNNPALALSECNRLVTEMANYSRDALLKAIALLDNYDEKDSDYVKDCETLTDKYEDKLGTYLVELSSKELSVSESHAVARMLHSIGDFERISDHALNICDLAEEIKEKKIVFSKDATAELRVVKSAILEILNLTTESFENDDVAMANKVEPLEQVIDKLVGDLKARHIERLQKGECTVQLGFVFNDLLANFERISDHCSNIAVYTIQKNSPKLDTHKYLRNVKSESDSAFADKFNAYKEKYSVE